MNNRTETNKTSTATKSGDMPMQPSITKDRDKTMDDQGVCIKAPEWAEHQRLWDDDLPCDDGRSGDIDDD